MKVIHKACPCIFRRKNGKKEMLVFQHPLAGNQVIKGTVEDNETIENAVLRELEEESGIKQAKIVKHLDTIEFTIKGGPKEEGQFELNKWHLYEVEVSTTLPESWEHEAYGSEAENGLIFKLFWQQLDVRYVGYHERFIACLDSVSRVKC